MKNLLNFIAFITAIACLSIGLSGCLENEDYVHPFTCKVNGKEWRPDSRLGQLSVLVDMSVENFLSISGSNANSRISVVINDSSGIEINKLYIFTDNPGYYGRYHIRENKVRCDYDYMHVVSGQLLISKLDKNSIAGTFEFTTYNSECGDTIRITEGRFNTEEIAY